VDGCSTVADARRMYMHLHDASWLQNEYWEKEALEHSEAYAVGRAIDELHRKGKVAKQTTKKQTA
jgi:hypothetical protein